MNELLLVLAIAAPADSVAYAGPCVTYKLPWGETVRVTRHEREALRVFSHFWQVAVTETARTRDRKARREDAHHGVRR